MSAESMLPLEGIRVIEIAHALAGPLAGAMLADMGADVVKVEKPDGGDDARQWGPPFGPDGTSIYFHGQNRNKRSVAVDLKSAEGVAALVRLCGSADVVIQTLRPGLVEKLGIDATALRAKYPRLIYCNISAFGSSGPMQRRPGFDPLLQAYGGIMSITGAPEGEPTFNGASMNDKAAGMFCVIGVLAALRRRDRTGEGGVVDTSLFEAAVHWVETPLCSYLATGRPTKRHGTGSAFIAPYQVFHASDHPLVIAAGNDRLFAQCAHVLGHPEWAGDPRFSTAPKRVEFRPQLIAAMQEAVGRRTRDELLEALETAGVPCAPVNDIPTVAASEQLAAIDLLQELPESGVKVVGLPFSFDGRRPRSARRAPTLGEHTAEILGESG